MPIRKNTQFIVLLFAIGLFIISPSLVLGAEESIVVTTYYPSPYGVYGEMRLYPKADATCNSQQEGLMYYDNNAGKHVLRVCGGNPLGWQDLGGGFWTASPFNSINIYNTNSGNVGIGTNDPQARLDVGGLIRTTNFMDAAAFRDVSNTAYYLDPSNAGTSLVTAGNVGIGTTGPSGKLDVQGGYLYVRDAEGTNTGSLRVGSVFHLPGIYASDAVGTAGHLILAADGDVYVGNPTAGTPNKWDTANLIVNNGNVGIGTTGPWANLHVRGNMNVEPTTTGNWQGLNAYNPNVGFWSHFPWGGDGWNYLSGNGTIFRHPSYGNTAWIRYDGSAYFAGPISTQGYSPYDNKGLGGGVHTWDVIAEGGIYVYAGNAMRVLFQNSGGGWMQATLDVQDVWLRNANKWASSFSDIRLKKNIKPLTNVLDGLQNIHSVSFDWNELYASLGHPNDKKQIGVIAQELEAQFPELVTAAGNESYESINYDGLTAVLIEAVNELKMQNDSARKRIQAMEDRIADLEKRRRIP